MQPIGGNVGDVVANGLRFKDPYTEFGDGMRIVLLILLRFWSIEGRVNTALHKLVAFLLTILFPIRTFKALTKSSNPFNISNVSSFF